MFQRFTHRARGAVVAAQQEARRLGAAEIQTGHLLLGVLAQRDGLGARALVELGVDPEQVRHAVAGGSDAAALRTLGIDLDSVRRSVEGAFGPGALERRGSPRGHIRFSAGAKKALELSLRESLRLRNRHIGTEHVLLGLLDAPHGMAAHVLAELGVTRDGVLAQARPGACEPRGPESLAIMPRLKRALELAVRVAEALGNRRANSEHLLVAITQVPDALAIELLGCLGVTAQDVLDAVAGRLDVEPAALVPARRRRRARLRS